MNHLDTKLTTELHETLVLRPSRVKWIAIAVFFFSFAALGTLDIVNTGQLLAWLLTLFFGLGAVLAVANMWPRRVYLALDREGFRIKTLFYSTHFLWSDVETYDVAYVGDAKRVVFRLIPDYTSQSAFRTKMRPYDRKLIGWEEYLPDTYGMKVEQLADLMNDWKRATQASYTTARDEP